MKDSIRRKLEKLDERFEEVSRLLSDPDVISRQNQFRELSMEYARAGAAWSNATEASLRSRATPTPRRELAMDEELAGINAALAAEELELQRLLVPKDPHGRQQHLPRSARRHRRRRGGALRRRSVPHVCALRRVASGWEVEILSESPGEHGGYKEIISRIIGSGAFSLLKFESGTHRVQRVPATEAQGRIHTSACTVAILPGAGGGRASS